jgi:repressor LexA
MNEGVQMRDELSQRQRKILGVIREAVTDRGYPPSIREIGEAVGLTSTSSVHSQLEALERKGFIRRDPTKPRAIEVFIEGAPVEPPRPLPAYVPLLGQIAAGRPILADENVDELMPLPRDLVGSGELFGLHVRGDSMIEAGVFDGDFVIVRSQPTAENGDMVAAQLEDFETEATVKYFHRVGGRVELRPANQSYHPIDGTGATILGKVVTVLRQL